jgi:hypothetical protein
VIGRPRAAVVALAAVAACNSAPPASRDNAARPAAPLDASPPDGPAGVRPAAAPSPPGAPRIIAMDEPTVALPSQESFRLLDPGNGARTALRYRPAAATTAVMARTRLTSRHFDRGERSAPTALPAIRDGFAIEIAADRPGRLALHALAGEAAADSRDADAYLAAWRTLLQDRRIAVDLDDRGAITAIRFDDDPTGARGDRARDELVQRLLSLIVPLPAEPVAIGARWRVVTILRQGPALAKQTATYTLIARGPAGWKLHVKLQRVGEPQRIVDPSLPPGTEAELVALFRALEGDVTVDPALPLIAGGELAIESRLHARLQPPGQPPIEQMFEDTGSVSFLQCRIARGTAAQCPEAR